MRENQAVDEFSVFHGAAQLSDNFDVLEIIDSNLVTKALFFQVVFMVRTVIFVVGTNLQVYSLLFTGLGYFQNSVNSDWRQEA